LPFCSNTTVGTTLTPKWYTVHQFKDEHEYLNWLYDWATEHQAGRRHPHHGRLLALVGGVRFIQAHAHELNGRNVDLPLIVMLLKPNNGNGAAH